MPRTFALQLARASSLGPVVIGLACLAAASACWPLRAAQGEDSIHAAIDAQVQAAWQARQVTPAPPASDAEFLRRAYLDLVGTIPSYEETLAFLDADNGNKRAELIDRLLADERFGRHQSEVWDMILFGRNPPGYDVDKRDAFRAWLAKQFNENVPYDVWAAQLLRAEGNSVDNGAPLYLVQYRHQPEDAMEAITQTFLGVQLQCARCHDHPFETWTQLDFYGMAAFLARLDVVNVGKAENVTKYAIGEKSSGDILFTGPVSQQEPGKKGEPVKPRFLLGDSLAEPELPADFKEVKFEDNKPPPAPMFSRKEHLAAWVCSSENPFFARAAANRFWGQMFGRGLVHPVDNMSPSNEPSHPELLAQLTAALVEHKFDLKWYLRELCNSQAYQLSSLGSTSEQFPRWFERARTRPLSAEELLDAWRVAVRYEQRRAAENQKPSDDRYAPLGSGYLLQFFGQPSNGTGDFQGGLREHLYLNNGGLGQMLGGGKESLHHWLLQGELKPEERVERLFLSTLNRRPSPEEQARFAAFLTEEERPEQRLEMAIWVLLSCSEFRFNH